MFLRGLFLALVWAVALCAQTGNAELDKLAAAAGAARQANDLPRAAELYNRALIDSPQWEEGWWQLGSVLYDESEYAKASQALSKLVALNPKAAPAWGLLGLCEFETAQWQPSLEHIQRALTFGFSGEDQMEGVLRYHEALLLIHDRDFDTALRKLSWFVQKRVHNDTMLLALGLAAERNPVFPEAVSSALREPTIALGNAAFLSMSGQTAEAQQALDQMEQRYPAASGVHYLRGTLLMAADPDKGVEEMRRELAVSPDNGAANATVAWMLLDDDGIGEAAPFAEKAIRGEPKLPLAQYAYGRSLVESGKFSEGIEHLETAVQMAPDILINRVALAAAYSKAGRPADARRERLEATRLAKGEHAPANP